MCGAHLKFVGGVMLLVGAVWASGCGKAERSASASAGPAVYVNPGERHYHSLGCSELRPGAVEYSKDQVTAQGYVPCDICQDTPARRKKLAMEREAAALAQYHPRRLTEAEAAQEEAYPGEFIVIYKDASEEVAGAVRRADPEFARTGAFTVRDGESAALQQRLNRVMAAPGEARREIDSQIDALLDKHAATVVETDDDRAKIVRECINTLGENGLTIVFYGYDGAATHIWP